MGIIESFESGRMILDNEGTREKQLGSGCQCGRAWYDPALTGTDA